MNDPDLLRTESLLCHRQDLIAGGELNEECSPELIVALAENALRCGRTPVALFGWFLQHEDSWTTVSKQDLAAARTRITDHRERQKKLAKHTKPAAARRRPVRAEARPVAKREERSIESDARAVYRPGPDYRVPPLPRYSQAQLDALSSPLRPHYRRYVLRHRVLSVIVVVATVAYLLTFQV